MADLLTFSTQWKDFFWIIFTLVAIGTSVLTYARVRKSIKFNISGNLTVLECLNDQELCSQIREAYLRALHGIELPDKEFGRRLEEFEGLEIHLDVEMKQELGEINRELRLAGKDRESHTFSEDSHQENMSF